MLESVEPRTDPVVELNPELHLVRWVVWEEARDAPLLDLFIMLVVLLEFGRPPASAAFVLEFILRTSNVRASRWSIPGCEMCGRWR